MSERALLVIDYQKDFVDGALGFPGAESIENAILEKITAYRAAGDDVIFTLDTHGEEYMQTQEGRHLPLPHCIRGTDGWQLTDALSCAAGDSPIIEKPTFGSLELANQLRAAEYVSVELVGLVSHICVMSNAILAKAALPNAEIIIDARCTASYDPVLHEKALDLLEAVHITVTHRAE